MAIKLRRFSESNGVMVVFINKYNNYELSSIINTSRSASLQSRKIRKGTDPWEDPDGKWYGDEAYIINDSDLIHRLISDNKQCNDWMRSVMTGGAPILEKQADELKNEIVSLVKSKAVFKTKDANELKKKLLELIK